MKLLHHLLASSVCVAALVSATATGISAQVSDVTYSGSGSDDGEPKRLRVTEENYDRADLYPGPEESEDERELVVAAGEEFETERFPVIKEAFEDEPLIDDGDSFDVVSTAYEAYGEREDPTEKDNGEDETLYEQDQLEYTRHLRSLVDSILADQIPVAVQAPPEEVTHPSSPSNFVKPSDVPDFPEQSEPKPSLRGPEKAGTL